MAHRLVVLLVALCLIGSVRPQAITFPIFNDQHQGWNIQPVFTDCDTGARTNGGTSTTLLLTPPFTIDIAVTNIMGSCLGTDEGVIFWYGNATHNFGVTIDAIATLRARATNGGSPVIVALTSQQSTFRVTVTFSAANTGAIFVTSQAGVAANLATTNNALTLFPIFTAATNFGFASPVGITPGSAIGGKGMAAFTGVLHEARIFNTAKNLGQVQTDAVTQFFGSEPGLLHLWKFKTDATTDSVLSGALNLVAGTGASPSTVPISTILTNNFLVFPQHTANLQISAATLNVNFQLTTSNPLVSLQTLVLTAPNNDLNLQTPAISNNVATVPFTTTRKSCGSTTLIGTPGYGNPGFSVNIANFTLNLESVINPGVMTFEILSTTDNIKLQSPNTNGFGLTAPLDASESIVFNYRNSTFNCTSAAGVVGNSISCANTGLPGAGNATVVLCKQTFIVPFAFPAPTITKVNAVNDGKFEIIGTNFGSKRSFVVGADIFSIAGPSVPVGYQCDATVTSDTAISIVCPNPSTSLSIGQSYTVTLNLGGQESTSTFTYQICANGCFNGQCTARDTCTCLPGFSGATCNERNVPVAAYAVPAAVGGTALIVAGIVGIIAYRRYKNPKRGGKTFIPLEKKDFTKIIYGESLLNNPSGKAAGDLLKLENSLLEDNLELAFAIANATQITEADEIAKAMITVFQANNKVLPLLKAFVGDEVRNSDSSGTLFRSNSFVSKMFKFYSRLIALPYLYTTIGPEINELLEDKVGLEVDPEKIEEGTDLDQMRWTLMAQSQKILKQIMNSGETCPNEFRVLFAHLKECVAEKFPDHINITIGGFIFLRFFCPAISSPEAYGLSEEPPSQESRRLLILITKVLQNLSNDVEFGSKEMYMTKMNDFIQVNRGKIAAFYKKLIEGADSSSTPLDMPRTARNAALHIIGNHLRDLDGQKKITDENCKKKIAEIYN